MPSSTEVSRVHVFIYLFILAWYLPSKTACLLLLTKWFCSCLRTESKFKKKEKKEITGTTEKDTAVRAKNLIDFTIQMKKRVKNIPGVRGNQGTTKVDANWKRNIGEDEKGKWYKVTGNTKILYRGLLHGSLKLNRNVNPHLSFRADFHMHAFSLIKGEKSGAKEMTLV